MEKDEEALQDEIPRISVRWQIFYVGITWIFWLLSLFTLFFIHAHRSIIPFAVAQLFYKFKIKKHKLAVLPRPVIARWHTSRLYNIFVSRVNGDRILTPYRNLGLVFLLFGIIPLLVGFASRVPDLDQMVIVRGTYEGYQELLGRGRCAHVIINIRLKDGSKLQILDIIGENDSPVRQLEQSKGEELTIWGSSRRFPPECRKFLHIHQVQSKGYQHFYNKERVKQTDRFFIYVSIFFMACGGLCLLRVVCSGRARQKSTS